jgi:hypothetical protein
VRQCPTSAFSAIPVGLIEIALILGSPGFLLGAIASALLGAVTGFALWLAGWLVIDDVI